MYKISDLKEQEKALNAINFILKHCKHDDFLFELHNVAIAQNFSLVAEKANMSQKNLYKILTPHSKPSWETIVKILYALGFELQIKTLKRIRNDDLFVYTRLNSLAKTNAELASQWHPIKNGKFSPEDIKANSRKKIWWKCFQGHEWSDFVISRTKGKDCPFCKAIKIINTLNNENQQS